MPSTTHGLLHHVDDVALLDKKVDPALAPVRGAHPIGRGLRVAMDQYQRIWMPNGLRRHYLNIDLAAHDVLAIFADVLPCDVEKAALANGRLIESWNR